MPAVNFSDTTPAPPAGATNVKWAYDANGNVSASVAAGGVTAGNLTETGSSVLTVTGGTGAVLGSGTSIQVKQASASQAGYLSAADWSAFNAKQNPLTLGNLTEATSSVLAITGGTGAVVGSGLSIQVKQASASQSGYLSSTDWNSFNNTWKNWNAAVNANGNALLMGSAPIQFNTSNASPTWQEFQIITASGASVSQDALIVSVNQRMTTGGADSFLPSILVYGVSGTVEFVRAVMFDSPVTLTGATLLANLNLNGMNVTGNGTFLGSLTFAGALASVVNLSLQTPNVATSSANNNSPLENWSGTYWNGSASATDTWQVQDVLGAGANPASTLTFSHTGSSGAASVQMPRLGVGTAARQQFSVGSYLDLYSALASNSPSVPSIRGVVSGSLGHIFLNGWGTGGAVFLNYDLGTGGVYFCDGAAGLVASMSNAGVLTCTGLSIPKFGTQQPFSTPGPLSSATGTFTAHGGLMIFFLIATGYCTGSGTTGVFFNIDGTAQIPVVMFINETLSHKALPPRIFMARPAAGTHSASFTAFNGSFAADGGDFFQCFALELPF
jgi:hypothetical protein